MGACGDAAWLGTDDTAPGHAAARDERSEEDLLGDPDANIVAVEETSPKTAPELFWGIKSPVSVQ
jgi:hypothetical protein